MILNKIQKRDFLIFGIFLFSLAFISSFHQAFALTTITYSANQEVCGDLTGYDTVTINPGVTVTVCARNSTAGTELVCTYLFPLY